jgi:hypothetical protein
VGTGTASADFESCDKVVSMKKFVLMLVSMVSVISLVTSLLTWGRLKKLEQVFTERYRSITEVLLKLSVKKR